MPARPYFAALHGLRGLSALLVAAYHFPLTSLVTNSGFVRGGWLAVDFFFVLSGLLMATLYGDVNSSEDRARFAVARIARLWPAHLAMLAVILGLELAKALATTIYNLPGSSAPFAGHTAPELFLANVSLTQAFVGISYPTWNDPAWSVSAEIGAYALFLALTFLPKRAQAFAWLTASGLGMLAILAASPSYMAAPINLGVFRCIAGFFLGCWLTQLPRQAAGGTMMEIAALLLAGAFIASASGAATMLAPFVFGFAIWAFQRDRGALSRLLALPPVRWLGDTSYALYLVHLPILIAATGCATLLGIGRAQAAYQSLLLLAYLIVCCVSAAALRKWVEIPGAALVKHLFSAPQAALAR